MLTISASRKPVATNEITWSTIRLQDQREITSCSGKFEKIAHDVDGELTVPDWFEFQRLVAQWHKERGATSSISKMAMCPSYQRIVADGKRFIPLILRQLENEGDEPDQWFWALRVITGADPVPDAARGDIVQMALAWLDWARGQYAW